jgi:hypothetical protein
MSAMGKQASVVSRQEAKKEKGLATQVIASEAFVLQP